MTEKPSDYEYIIYCITCIPTNMKYVGQTHNYKYKLKTTKWYKYTINNRFNDHLYDTRTFNRPLHVAIKEHGKENFKIEELERCSENDSSYREHYWINKLNTLKPNGYNKQIFSRQKNGTIAKIGVPEYLEIKGIKENNVLKRVRVLIKYEEYESKVRYMFHEDTFENTVKKATDECLKIIDRSKIFFHVSLQGILQNPVEQYKEKLNLVKNKQISKIRVSLLKNNTVVIYIRTIDMKIYKEQIILNIGGPKTDVNQSINRARIIINELKKYNDGFEICHDDRIMEIMNKIGVQQGA
jgi:hypothetical protein